MHNLKIKQWPFTFVLYLRVIETGFTFQNDLGLNYQQRLQKEDIEGQMTSYNLYNRYF